MRLRTWEGEKRFALGQTTQCDLGLPRRRDVEVVKLTASGNAGVFGDGGGQPDKTLTPVGSGVLSASDR